MTGMHQRCCGDLAADFFFHRQTFACKCRFVDLCVAIDDHCVNCDALTGFDHKHIAYNNVISRNLRFFAVANHTRGVRNKAHELRDGVRGSRFGSGFKILAQTDKRQNHGGRIEVEIVSVVAHSAPITGARRI